MTRKFMYLFFMLLALVGNANANIVFKDAADREITLKEPAKKVAIVYNFVEYAAISGDECYQRVVGIGKKAWFKWRKGVWDEYIKVCPEIEQIADIGLLRFGDFYMEKLISLQPDVLILPKWQFDAIDETLKKQFQKAGVMLVVTDYANQALDTHLKSTLAIGHVIGKTERAKKIAEHYTTKFKQIIDLIQKVEKKGKVYIEKGQKGPDVIDDTWSKIVWGDMLDTAGGLNIADGVIPAGKNGQLSKEKILISNPEHIFIVGSNWVNSNVALVMGYGIDKEKTNKRLMSYASRSGWNNIIAIKNKNLFAIHHGLSRSLMDYAAIQYIAKQLHPEEFSAIDPDLELKEFHDVFLPVDYNGTWFLKANFNE